LIDAEVVINFTEETTENDVVTVIATQPLTDNETWHKMTKGQWHLFCLGESIASGQEVLKVEY
jgi:glutamine amidotransferase